MQIALPGLTVTPGALILAQSAREAEAFGVGLEALLWMGAFVLGLSVVAVAVLASVRRRLRAPASRKSPSFTLDQVRQMRERGDLTDSEYEAVRRRVLHGL